MQVQLGCCIAVAVARPAAVAPIRPLAWQPPYAMGEDLKKDKRQKKKKKRKKESPFLCTGCYLASIFLRKDVRWDERTLSN